VNQKSITRTRCCGNYSLPCGDQDLQESPAQSGKCKTTAIETLMNKGDQRSHELVSRFHDGFGQSLEQLGGVQGTLSTYLEFFINPESPKFSTLTS
jgi:hypothetical protein